MLRVGTDTFRPAPDLAVGNQASGSWVGLQRGHAMLSPDHIGLCYL